MASENNEAWLEVLAGRAEPRDRATRQAASLRHYFALQAAADMAGASDPEGEKRVMNMLRLRGAFDAPPAPAPVARTGLAGWLAWLLPPGQGNGGRFAMAAACAFALVLSPALFNQGQAPRIDDGSKGFVAPPADLVQSAQPAADAAQLVAQLAAAGIAAQARPEGAEHVVRAQVAPAQRAAAARQLDGIGIALPATGALVVRFQAVQP
ncbi:MAG: hypothetical protein V4857_11290 [Pseudomonadota bacterium]